MTTLDQFLSGSGKPKSPSQSDELFEEFKSAVGAKVSTSIEWTNDADFSCGMDNETFQEVSAEKAMELVGGDEDEFAERFDFGSAWNGIWGSFGEGRTVRVLVHQYVRDNLYYPALPAWYFIDP